MTAENATNTTTARGGLGRNLDALPQLIPIGILIILTNSLVFRLFYSRQSLRKASNYLLVSLAVCDFLNGSLNISLFLMSYIPVVPYGTAKFFGLVCAVEVSHNFIAITAACHITLITAEKYIAIMRPFTFHVIKKRTMLLVIVGAWLISGLVTAAPIGWFYKRLTGAPNAVMSETVFNIFCLFFVFAVPYVFIIYAHVAMFRKAFKKKSHNNILCRNSSRTVCKKKKNELKCLVIFATMAAVFLFCWLPWFSLRLVFSLDKQKLITRNNDATATAAQIIVIARYVTSAINPLLYTFFKQDFWKALKRMVLKMSKKEPRIKSSSVTESSYRLKRRTTKTVTIPNSRDGKLLRNQRHP